MAPMTEDYMVISLNYCSQNGGNVYRDPYYNRNPNIGPRIKGNLDQYPHGATTTGIPCLLIQATFRPRVHEATLPKTDNLPNREKIPKPKTSTKCTLCKFVREHHPSTLLQNPRAVRIEDVKGPLNVPELLSGV